MTIIITTIIIIMIMTIRTVEKLSKSWNTIVVATTKQGRETSEPIRFLKGLPQGDALCPRLFTVCLNPIAWKISVSEGY